MNKILLIALVLISSWSVKSQVYTLNSPDASIDVKLDFTEHTLHYQVFKNKFEIIQSSEIGMHTSAFDSEEFAEITAFNKSMHNALVENVWGISDKVEASYNKLELAFGSDVKIQFRAYNSGVAWRFVTNYDEDMLVYNEEAQFNLPSTSRVYFPATKGFSTPFEANYLPLNLSDVEATQMGLTPLLIKTAEGVNMVISEVNLVNYPGMFVEMNTKGLRGVFPAYPSKETEQFAGRWRLTNTPQLSKKLVRKTEDFIAQCGGTRNFPWRMIIIEDNDTQLLENQLTTLLADKAYDNEQYSWVKPGKVVWDWYHKWNLQDVDFKAGINTMTYKYMIDFAAEYHLQYVNIDDGWSQLHNFQKINKNLDLKAILSYAKQKDVGIFLWCTWQTLQENMIENLDYFQDLGIAGLKVDFFDRCDQNVVDFINQLATQSAQRHLLLNLHGVYKPTGLQVTHPNVVNFEGVIGLEYNKFSDKCTPTHNATIPFVRNVVGPMDYTPGGMRYVDSLDFEISWDKPHVMTTRAQQLAMYVVYHGGIQMLADSPTFFKRDTIAMHFLENVPVSWDQTVAIDGKIGEYAVLARRKGARWYIAGIAGAKGYEGSITLDFLEPGDYQMISINDGYTPEEVRRTTRKVKYGDTVQLGASSTGGFILELSKINL